MRTFNESEQLLVEAFYDRRFPTVVMLILFSIVGIPGNIIVLLVYSRKRLTSTQFLISVIAMVDLFTAGVAIPFAVTFHTAWFSILDVAFCKVVILTGFIGTYPGVYLIWGLSIVRYYHVCRPHELYFVETKVKLFCVFVFGISLLLSGIMFYIGGFQTPKENELPAYNCDIADKYENGVLHIFILLLFTVLLLFCLISMVVLYCLILRRVLKHNKTMNMYKNKSFNKCELLPNEEDRKSKDDKSSDVKSHISLRSNKQNHTHIEQIKENTTKRMKNKRKSKKSTGSQNIIFNKSIGFHRTTLKVAIIGIVYVLTYVPWISIRAYLNREETSRAQMHNLFKYVLIPGMNLIYLGCAVNPMVYFGDPIFRSQCRAIFRKT